MGQGEETPEAAGHDRNHEIRTHLTTILGYGELLTVDELTARQREAADAIVTAGRRILRLIDDPARGTGPSDRR